MGSEKEEFDFDDEMNKFEHDGNHFGYKELSGRVVPFRETKTNVWCEVTSTPKDDLSVDEEKWAMEKAEEADRL